MESPPVRQDVDEIAMRIRPILRRHGVLRASLYGSVVKGTAGPQSDVDILVELPMGKSLLDLVALKRDLEAALGRRVDLAEFDTVHPLIRDRVMAQQVAVA